MARRKKSRLLVWLVFLAGAAALAFGYMALFRAGPPPEVELSSDLPGIGKATEISVSVREPARGLAGYRVELVQGERVEVVDQREFTPIEPWKFWGPRTSEDSMTVTLGSATIDDLREGEATVRVVARRAGALLRRPQPVVKALELPVKLRPPLLQVTSKHTYVKQGGCEAVVYRVGESSVRDGVRVGDWFFPGWPLPGGDEQARFALFAIPYDMDDVSGVRLVADDDVGNESRAGFIDQFTPRPLRRGSIPLSDSFMERVVPPILGQSPELEDQGDLLANYLMINGTLRKRNAETLVALADRSERRFLWTRPFLEMRNAKVMSRFATRRSYTYDRREVDVQDHLGVDLASTSQAEIQSANDGVVLLARYLGIYGNAVVVDHGYGLMSLYGHLSSLGVEEGQTVTRGQSLGRSGATGLAAGDHLHFSMLLRGLPVDPHEWWDGHWIHDRLELKLRDALPFKE